MPVPRPCVAEADALQTLLALITGLIACCTRADGSLPTFQVEEWPTSTPRRHGTDSRPLDAMKALIEENDVQVYSIVIIRPYSRITSAAYRPRGRRGQPFNHA